MDLLAQLAALDLALRRHNEAVFSDEEEELRQNRLLKLRLRDLIAAAHLAAHADAENQALALLSASTGCAADYAIFTEIADDLASRGIVDAQRMQACLEQAPASRWL